MITVTNQDFIGRSFELCFFCFFRSSDFRDTWVLLEISWNVFSILRINLFFFFRRVDLEVLNFEVLPIAILPAGWKHQTSQWMPNFPQEISSEAGAEIS